MTERQTLLESIVEITADYRAGDLPAPTAKYLPQMHWLKDVNDDTYGPWFERL